MPMTAKEMIKFLEKNGFVWVSSIGSHYKMKHEDGRMTIVPFHSKDLPTGTEKKILKQAGLKKGGQ